MTELATRNAYHRVVGFIDSLRLTPTQIMEVLDLVSTEFLDRAGVGGVHWEPGTPIDQVTFD